MSKKRKLSGAFVFLACCSLITLLFDCVLVVNVYWQIRAAGYEQTVGRVTHSELTVHRGANGPSRGVDIRYSYGVDGVEHEGVTYRYGLFSWSGRYSRKIVDSLPVGKEVDVHYDSGDPTDSVLAVGLQGSDLFLALLLTPFNLITLGGWYLGLVRLLRPFVRQKPVRDRITRRGVQVRLQMYCFSPVKCAQIAAGATALVLSAPLALVFGLNPPIVVAQAAWFVVLGSAVLVFAWVCRPGAADSRTLVIDEVSGIWTLPCTCGRKTPMEVSVASIKRVEVEERVNDSLPETSPLRNVTQVELVLSAEDDGGNERREGLLRFRDKQWAEPLAQWLTEELSRVVRR